MKLQHRAEDPLEILAAARKIADFASSEGVTSVGFQQRASYVHIGAVLADAVLQAGLNYRSVVRPRVNRILLDYPSATTCAALVDIVNSGHTSEFLGWKHQIKIARFDKLVITIHSHGVVDVAGLRLKLREQDFCESLQTLNGIGPKTVDYMSCLVGIESIAVDRHIRSFAKRGDVHATDYSYLKQIFCCAADLLSMSRREFDAWIWRKESISRSTQLSMAL